MCTTISDRIPVTGRGKGAHGWFTLDHAYLGYDHPTSAPAEHAVLLDFVNESAGPGARVAVELTLDSARELAMRLADTIERADAHEQ